MTKLESTIVKKLFHPSLVEVYMRYGGDALLLDKEIDIYLVQKPLYFFDKNIKLTVDTLQDGKVYFLDIWIVKVKQISISLLIWIIFIFSNLIIFFYTQPTFVFRLQGDFYIVHDHILAFPLFLPWIGLDFIHEPIFAIFRCLFVIFI